MAKSGGDHALAIIKAGIAAVPVVGGSVASLIGDYVPTSTQRALEKAVEKLEKDLTALSDRVDLAAIDRDEFAEIFKSAYLELVRTYKKIKRDAAVGIIVNAMLGDGDSAKLTFSELDHFSRSLGQLSAGALEVLCVAVDRSSPARPGESRRRMTFSELDDAFPDWDSDLVMGLASELHGTNLLHVSQVGGVRTDNYGNYPVEITEIGARFVEHVLRLGSE